MNPEDPESLVDNVNVNSSSESDRSSPSKKKKMKKVPKRVQKAEREKLKRDLLNSHFLALSDVLELTEPKSGKASLVCETIRFLNHTLGQIKDLQKENAALLSESNYVTIERNELMEENSILEAQIKELRNELEAKFTQHNNSPADFHQGRFTTYLQGEYFKSANVKIGQPEAPAVFVLPVPPELNAYPMPDPTQIAEKPMAHVRKPQPRYPSAADSWHSQLLTEEVRSSERTSS